ncbi:MAG: CCA tRNA nucleotidyltransferase [Planctomycetes bacterium]|nr:CCA tRNA nucleotidyltransferase [Planctomycetota bacterium]
MALQVEAAGGAVDELKRRGFKAWWVGGAVRDRLMRREPAEYDIATTALPDDVEEIFGGEGGCRVVTAGRSFGVQMVRYGGFWFEIATLRRDHGYSDRRHPDSVEYGKEPRADAERRDFTVNAMYEDPVTGEVLDFFGGRIDIENRVLKAVGVPGERFGEDHLRKVRLVRFAAQLGFTVDAATWEAVLEDPALDVSRERIRDELVRMLTGPGPGTALGMLKESGMLKVFLPEVDRLAGVKQPPEFHPEGDVFVHTVLMFRTAAKPMDELLALAVLLHDVGKAVCMVEDAGSGRIGFPEHDSTGASLAEEILKRLRFSNRTVDAVSELVRGHMRIKDAPKMRRAKQVRLITDPLFPRHLELHRLDCMASHGKLDVYNFLAGEYRALQEAPPEPERLISGNDLIEMGLVPGPLIGEVLTEIRDLQLEGAVTDRASALAKAREIVDGRARPGR